MKRTIAALVIALGLLFASRALEAKPKEYIPADLRMAISIARWQDRSDRDAILKKVAHMKPVIDELCREHGVNPHVIYGLIMTESCANPQAIDYMFASGLSDKVHVGLGQLNKYKLPAKDAQNRNRIEVAHLWRRVHLYRMKIQRRLKRNETNELEYAHERSMAVEANLMKKWARLDPRFDAKWNLEETIVFFKFNLQKCGEETLAIMGHHGGGNDPVRRVIRYARDHEKVRLTISQVPVYVRKHKLNYMKLYDDHRSPGHQYWARKGDGHLTYAFSPMAGSQVFEEYWKDLQPGVQSKIMACSASGETRQVGRVTTEVRVASAKKAQKGSGRESMIVGMTDAVAGYFTGHAMRFVGHLAGAGYELVMLILGLASVAGSLLAIRYIIWPLIIRRLVWGFLVCGCLWPFLVLASRIAWALICELASTAHRRMRVAYLKRRARIFQNA